MHISSEVLQTSTSIIITQGLFIYRVFPNLMSYIRVHVIIEHNSFIFITGRRWKEEGFSLINKFYVKFHSKSSKSYAKRYTNCISLIIRGISKMYVINSSAYSLCKIMKNVEIHNENTIVFHILEFFQFIFFNRLFQRHAIREPFCISFIAFFF